MESKQSIYNGGATCWRDTLCVPSFLQPRLLLLLQLLSRFSHVRLCATPQTAAHKGLASTGFSRQEYWSALPFHSPVLAVSSWQYSIYTLTNISHPLPAASVFNKYHSTLHLCKFSFFRFHVLSDNIWLFAFLFLAYFTYCNALKVHPYCQQKLRFPF